MKAIHEKSRATLAHSPALELVLALARHRAALDHRNAKLTKYPSTDFETIDSKSITCTVAIIDGDDAALNQEMPND
jgi:hypothetical protein